MEQSRKSRIPTLTLVSSAEKILLKVFEVAAAVVVVDDVDDELITFVEGRSSTD